ncbi:hypothetical protein GQ53DRAFT_832185 [Thozetella sp. PMI_491]|nr:hypothetical protein GQ53DRAFT_832185 [Thozetella sp. PMI_491]
MDSQTIATVSNVAFGLMCIGSAAPFVGIPFPKKATADYYRRKNEWLAKLSGHRLTNMQAGYAGALLRISVGLGVIWPQTREPLLLLNGAIVSVGTVLAIRDKKPMIPQWTMLGMVAWCLVTNRLARA